MHDTNEAEGMISRFAKHDWDDPFVTGRNRVGAHSPLGAYPDAAMALRCDRSASPFVMSLNGVWKFQLTGSPADMPAGFTVPQCDDSAWLDMPVPSNWQLHNAVDDQPIYTNIAYPFEETPPEPPKVNPTGWYRTVFEVPDDWRGRELFLRLESCDSACKVWINGVEAGYSEDSKLPHEFNITPLLQDGTNYLAVMVPRYCSGFWLEDQDYWHLSGIQRDVVLYSKPRAFIRDFVVRTSFDASYHDAELLVTAYRNDAPDMAEGYSFAVTLHDAEGEVVAQPDAQPVSTKSPMYVSTESERGAARFCVPVTAPRVWTAETPYLYTVVITLRNPAGEAVDFESCRVGFRQIEIRDRQLMLNGKRLVVRGVNWHEHHPERGRALTVEDMRESIVAMKRLNFNAIRTSHYPRATAFYELCDELGMYVVDETNLETHGIEAMASKDPLWMNAYMERAQRMALRDKNHPCIVAWSLGNESSCGPHHAAMAAWLRYYDPTRPVQYESGNPGPAISDIMVPMYPQLLWIEKVMADASEARPLIMCEYAYGKGNATGNIHKYWELVDRYKSFQGGFMWDWADKAHIREINGRPEWAYGNEFDGGIGPDGFDYGRRENPQMCLNGIVNPDLTPKPGAFELKKAQAPVGLSVKNAAEALAGNVHVVNKYLRLDLSHLAFDWQLLEDGGVVQEGTVESPPVGPGESGLLSVPVATGPSPQPGREYFLSVTCRYREDTPWCAAGHVVAWEQFALPFAVSSERSPGRPAVTAPAGAMTFRSTPESFIVAGDGFEITFDKQVGALSQYRVSERSLLTRPLEHVFMRARTDNDYIIGNAGSYYAQWKEAGLDRLRTKVLSCEGAQLEDGTVIIRCQTRHCAEGEQRGFDCISSYLIRKDGNILVENTVAADSSLPVLPRIGMRVGLDAGLEQLSWYGRGPHESYIDRKQSALVGLYHSTVEEQFFPFVDPCECGGHEDTRWLNVHDGSGVGLRVVGQPQFHFSALHYTSEDLMQAGHVYELHRTPEVQLHIDGFHMGLGGDTGWTNNVHPEYLLPPGTYRYRFALRVDGHRGRDMTPSRTTEQQPLCGSAFMPSHRSTCRKCHT
jgi:beta-galactosidase